MDSLFVVPTVVGPSVDDKIVPAICKLVERNILINYFAVFRNAAIRKYLGPYAGLNVESEDVLERLKNLRSLFSSTFFISITESGFSLFSCLFPTFMQFSPMKGNSINPQLEFPT